MLVLEEVIATVINSMEVYLATGLIGPNLMSLETLKRVSKDLNQDSHVLQCRLHKGVNLNTFDQNKRNLKELDRVKIINKRPGHIQHVLHLHARNDQKLTALDQSNPNLGRHSHSHRQLLQHHLPALPRWSTK